MVTFLTFQTWCTRSQPTAENKKKGAAKSATELPIHLRGLAKLLSPGAASAQRLAHLGRFGCVALVGLLLHLLAQLPRAQRVEGQPGEGRHLPAHRLRHQLAVLRLVDARAVGRQVVHRDAHPRCAEHADQVGAQRVEEGPGPRGGVVVAVRVAQHDGLHGRAALKGAAEEGQQLPARVRDALGEEDHGRRPRGTRVVAPLVAEDGVRRRVRLLRPATDVDRPDRAALGRALNRHEQRVGGLQDLLDHGYLRVRLEDHRAWEAQA
eukprot:scaffold9148_cov59-Phaeocystis_antarctica.AAC.5